jgi:hypothetical protein
MDFVDRALYHQIHPLKLVTDTATSIVGIWLLAGHRLAWALVVMLLPPAVVSGYLMAFARLESLRASHFGQHVRRSMTASVIGVRLVEMLMMCVGAFRRRFPR